MNYKLQKLDYSLLKSISDLRNYNSILIDNADIFVNNLVYRGPIWITQLPKCSPQWGESIEL
jgi:hypothetical protein